LFHLLAALGTKNGCDIVLVHNRFTRQINEEESVLITAASIVLTEKTIFGCIVLRIGREFFHLFTAFGTENGCQIISIHYRFLGKFQNKRALVAMDAGFAIAVEFG
jgi:hypothetical protein